MSEREPSAGSGRAVDIGDPRFAEALAQGLARAPQLSRIGVIDMAGRASLWRSRDGVVVSAAATDLEMDQARVAAPARTGDGLLQAWQRVSFAPDLVIAAQARAAALDNVSQVALKSVGNDLLRLIIASILGDGLATLADDFPRTDIEFAAIVAQLRALPASDLNGRLALGGFADHPLGSGEERMRCQECVYFLPHRGWCDLPELPLPVEPDWYCRLWRM
jgi:hypothetical protein